jgi:hypothetical protein
LHELVGTYRTSFSELLYHAKVSPGATPLNFVAQKLALDLLGFSSFVVRLPAILFATASLWLFHRIARELTGSYWPFAVAMFAIIPHVYRYGVEARPYSQGLFFALVAFRCWKRADQEPSAKNSAAYALAVAACLYSHVFSVFPAVAPVLISLRNSRARLPVSLAAAAAVAAYIPWYLVQKATQAAASVPPFMLDWNNFTVQGIVRELSGGGYFASIPILILAAAGFAFTKDIALAVPAVAALAGPLLADAVMGYFFAGRQLIFAIPFLVLLATFGMRRVPVWSSAVLLIPLAFASLKADFRQAVTVREDWASAAHSLAAYPCISISPDQLPYLQVYEPTLRLCDLTSPPAEFAQVTTRYSPPSEPVPAGYRSVRRDRIGVAEVVVYRRDASLKTYGIFRFVLRTQVQHHGARLGSVPRGGPFEWGRLRRPVLRIRRHQFHQPG